MTLLVRQPGFHTTVQDGGRRGWQRYGVPVGGPMDAASHTAANVLVGNEPHAAALELTLYGGAFETEAGLRIAVCGADLEPTIDGAPMPMWRPVDVSAGSTIRFGSSRAGRFAYLAAAGGIRSAAWLGSRAAAPRSALPAALPDGLPDPAVRPLRAGDRLPVAIGPRRTRSEPAAFDATHWFLGAQWRFSAPDHAEERVVRAMRGREWDKFDPQTRSALEAGEWTCIVQGASDRMGYRLRAAAPASVSAAVQGSMLSEAVTAGTVQAPPDGEPIALMADRQTTGGYPRLLQIADVDIGLLAQARPGALVRFALVSLEEAVFAKQERSRQWQWLADRLAWESDGIQCDK